MYYAYDDEYEAFGFKDITSGIKTGIDKAGEGIKTGANTVGSGVTTGANVVAGGVTTGIDKAGDGIKTGVNAAGNLGKNVLSKARDGIFKAFASVFGFLGNLKWLISLVCICCCLSFLAPTLMPAFLMFWRL